MKLVTCNTCMMYNLILYKIVIVSFCMRKALKNSAVTVHAASL